MIYLLSRKDEYIGYDEYDAMVVCAGSQDEARRIANNNPGDEGGVWIDPESVTVEEIDPDLPHGLILGSFNAG